MPKASQNAVKKTVPQTAGNIMTIQHSAWTLQLLWINSNEHSPNMVIKCNLSCTALLCRLNMCRWFSFHARAMFLKNVVQIEHKIPI
jgi:hypothetical protein